jgi:hypothetical protein
MTKYVISQKNLPSKLPIFSALVTFMALDHYECPEWAYGAAGLFFFIAFALAFYGIVIQESVVIFPQKEEDSERNSAFKERLAKAMQHQEKFNKK